MPFLSTGTDRWPDRPFVDVDLGAASLWPVGQLRSLGVDQRAIAALVQAGRLAPITRGWYAARQPTNAEDRHRLATEALAVTFAGRAVPSHYSELLRLGLPLYRADLATVHLTRVDSDQSRRRPGLVVHRQLPGSIAEGRLRPAWAIVQTGMVCGPMDALIAADAALHRELLTDAELVEALAGVAWHPRSGRLSAFLSLADRRSESPGETRLRHVFHLLRLPVFSQAQIRADGRLAVADFMLAEHPVIAEFDGMVKYADRDGQTGRAVLAAEKEREDWVRGLGFEVERVIWRELDELRLFARRMRRAIDRAAARPTPPAWLAAVEAARSRGR